VEEWLQPDRESSAVIGNTILRFEEIDSTNTCAKRLALEGAADGTVVIADVQTAGRGRMGRTFLSPKGKGIYLSVLLRPDLPAERLACVTPLAGIAVCDAVEAVCSIRPGLKWPNDPVLGKRKLCGILTEAVTDPAGRTSVILGIGINVLQTEADFTPEIRSIATSLLMETGRAVSREELIGKLLERLEEAYLVLKGGNLSGWVQTYRQDCVHLGRQIWLIGPNGREKATALDVDESFGLVVADETGAVRTVRTGEISVRGLFGYTE
jgi:BirA family biotin operon repressor/biotin-[acetyl-CoA-carboxylase] ligase